MKLSFWNKVVLYKELIRCHIHYLFSKMSLWIFVLVMFVSILGNYMSLHSIQETNSGENLFQFYLQESFFIHKILGTFYVVFLFSYANLAKQNQYCHLIIVRNITRSAFITTKWIALMLTVGGYVLFQCFFLVLIGMLAQEPMFFTSVIATAYFHLWLMLGIYGGWAWLMVLWVQNLYGAILPFACMNISAVLADQKTSNLANQLFQFFCPNIVEITYYMSFGTVSAVFLLFFLYMSGLFLFLRMDIN